MKNLFLSSILLIGAVLSCQNPQKEFVKEIEAYRTSVRNPGLAVAVVKGGEIVYSAGFGSASLEEEIPIDPERSLFRIASISKSFSATSMMQLIEAGKVTLDTDVSDLAGFPIRNPAWPDVPITLEMLMSHTSSLNDSEGYFVLDVVNPATNPDWAKCYNPYKPGTGYEYCNLNFNLVGSFIEKLSGERFDQYVVHHVLEPLGLYGGYCVDSLDTSRFVKLYYYDEKEDCMKESVDAYAPRSERIANYTFGYDTPVFSPTGGMKISACDLARYMMMHMGYGTSPKGVKIISEESSRNMQTPRSADENYGLALRVRDDLIPGLTLIGHTGGAYGLRSAMFWPEDRSFGLVMISSGSDKEDDDVPSQVIPTVLQLMYKYLL